nr:immunoglobulin heavy chain junction region [Mus musculus]MBK4195261.1 immunoglobulin heavy chain junction region [Mus musculus]
CARSYYDYEDYW